MSLFKSFVLIWLAILSSFCLGCSGASSDKTLVPVSGVVHVDDEPASGVTVTVHPLSGSGAVSSATTLDDGSFQISTYELNDGVPPGVYKATFAWGQFDLMSRTQVGDRLDGRYASADDSTIEWTIDGGSPVDVGIIKLRK
ncbi:hypothetical protein Q31b_08570 [Novipirellula aureliae]|uniref:Carboxypeptidase regulatory-like domain-containing protein n=1 Tax=Novipirellula aureliae TaxID=2527966 RepID=A0A5C6EDA0_9BACT|nr:carboxypeptidase-like regulatory domain-containing protein [Novipirellula aureliae]TWU45681.1 hypothetical protein Q31b_08570 [Novipirellula aureliae]